MVAETTLDEKAKALRLGISNADIASRITNDPNFRGVNGAFDRDRFAQIIRNAGYTEARFVEEQRRVMLRRQIALSIGGDFVVPATAMTAVNQYQNEKRAIDYLTLGAAQAGDIPSPTPEALGKYFDERKVLFRAPEYRKVTLLAMSPAELAKPDAVSDADAKTYFEQHKANYGTPERRELNQIVFPETGRRGRRARAHRQGRELRRHRQGTRLEGSDTDVGMVTKAGIIDPAVADAAFALKSGEVSAPVKGRFGTVLLQVGKIEPGNQKTYEEVAPQIKREIAESRAKTEIGDLRDKFEDERAAGSTLAEAAKKLGLKSRTIDAVDRSGRGPDGKPIADLPKHAGRGRRRLRQRRRRRQRSAATAGRRLPLVRRHRHHAGARSHARRGEGQGRGALARRRDRQAPAGQGRRHARQAQSRHGAGAACHRSRPESGDRNRPATRQAGRLRACQAGRGGVQDAKGRAGERRRRSGDHALRVPRDRRNAIPQLDPIADASRSTLLQNSYSDDIVGAYVARLENDFGVTFNQQALNQVIGGAPANSGNSNDFY